MDILELFFPWGCRLCGAPPPPAALGWRGICPRCLAELRPLSGPRCGRCGRPLVSEEGLCVPCRGRAFSFEANHPLLLYSGKARDFLQAYKFSKVFPFAPLLARGLASLLDGEGAFAGWREGSLCLIPAPSSAKKRAERGWSPVGRVARSLVSLSREGGRKGLGFLEALEKLPGKDQKELSFTERLANLEGRIRIRREAAVGAFPHSILLLDDIFTTGATASECARVLKEGGAREVRCLTLAVDP